MTTCAGSSNADRRAATACWPTADVPDALVAAALACRDEADMLACLDAQRAGRRRPNR